MTAIMLFPFETSMPTEFIHIPPIQMIRNRNPSFSHCRFNLLGDTNSMAQPAQIERYNKRMANSLSCGHESPRRCRLASCSSYCSLGTRWKGSRTGCPASLSKYIVIGGEFCEGNISEILHAYIVKHSRSCKSANYCEMGLL